MKKYFFDKILFLIPDWNSLSSCENCLKFFGINTKIINEPINKQEEIILEEVTIDNPKIWINSRAIKDVTI